MIPFLFVSTINNSNSIKVKRITIKTKTQKQILFKTLFIIYVHFILLEN